MFNSFQVLGQPGSAPTEVTQCIAEALVPTAAGLLIAIVGIVFFNTLQTRVRLQMHELETLKIMLVNRFGGDSRAETPAEPIQSISAEQE